MGTELYMTLSEAPARLRHRSISTNSSSVSQQAVPGPPLLQVFCIAKHLKRALDAKFRARFFADL